MASLLGQLPAFDVNNDIPKSFLNVLQELYHDGRLTSWKVRGRGDILSVRLTWFDPDHRNACIKAKARQHLGSLVSFVPYDANVKRELKEYSTRLALLVERLQEDLSERNTYNNHRSVRDKSKEGLKVHQQQLTTEIARARVALSGPLRRSNTKTNTTHERDLQNLLIQQTEQVLRTNLQQFHRTLTEPNSLINNNNFDQKLAQAIFDKCVSKEIFQELPDVIDASAPPPPKPLRQTSNTSSSLTSLTKPSSSQPTWSNSSSASWEIKSRNDNIRKVIVSKRSAADEEEDTIKEDDEDEHLTNGTTKYQAITTTESIEFDNGLKLDLSSADDELTNRNHNRQSVDSDLEAIKRSKAKVGEWQTNFTLTESKSPHSGDETPRSTRDTLFLTVPISADKDLSPRVGDKPLEDLADDDLYADDESSSYPIPINTVTLGEHSQVSDNESTTNRKLFPLPANLLLQNHSSCSFRRPSYTYESDNDSITSTSNTSLVEMKTFIDEDKFRMDPSITDPKFVQRPKDTTSRFGETAKFKTKVQGTEPIDIFWFRFGTDDELVNDEKYQLSHDDSYHYLKIYSTRKEDEGAYLCVVANDKAQNVDIAKLSVKDNKRQFNPPTIISEFIDADVCEGASLTLKCKLNQGYPKSRVLWYKENTLIQPNEHYKLYYYGDGQHVLHVDEATIEDDNGTFTCLALNAAGRVQITADVFVHEKEVIDIPHDSPVVRTIPRTLRKQEATRKHSNMNDDDEQQEGEPLTISPPLSPIPRPVQSDDEELNAKRYMDKFRSDRSSQLLEDWQHLYEASVQSLESDDVGVRSVPQQQKPFYLERRPSIEKPIDEAPRSPIPLPQPERNVIKPKWEIRLPQLLNSTVGPDRQIRDHTRRHTTNIVFQQNQQQPTLTNLPTTQFNPVSQSISASPMPTETDNGESPSLLVRQLKQKFDRIYTANLTQEYSKSHSQSHIHRVGNDEIDGAYPLLPKGQTSRQIDDDDHDHEVASLTCRGLTSNNGERSTTKSRPVLPMNEKKTNPITSVSFDASLLANRTSHDKGNNDSIMSLPQRFDNQRSTTNVVKKLIGGGATLVYDSSTPNNKTSSSSTPSFQHQYYPNHQYQQQRKEHVRIEQTTQSLTKKMTNHQSTNKNSLTLTGRQLQPNSSPSHNTNSKSTKNVNNNDNNNNTNNNNNNHEKQQDLIPTKDSRDRSTPLSDKTSNPAKSVQTKSTDNSFDLTSPSSSNLSTRSITPVGRKSVLARAELWDRRISTNENDNNDVTITYDIEQWSNEFERVQNQN